MTNVKLRSLTVAAALALGASLCSTSALAQTSFGRMRDASEKGKSAPKLEEEDDGALQVEPTAKPKKKAEKKTEKIEPSKADDANKDDEKVRSAESEKDAPVAENADEKPAESTSKTPSNRDGASRRRPASPSRNAASPADQPSAGRAIGANGRGPILGRAVSHKYRAGMIFQAQPGGTCVNVFGSAPVPTDFPEQKVRTLEEDFPKSAKVSYRELKEGGARQMVFKMRELRAGNGVEASALFEVARNPIAPPSDPSIYLVPKSVSPNIRQYLRESKFMESNSKTIRNLAKETTKDVEGAWDKVAAILARVRDDVQYKEVLINKPMRGALAAVRNREGDCEDMCALFIAMCRAVDVPARLVRVPGHCWAEFYLVDDEKEGYWFPAQVAGTEELGSLQDTRVILQKGDSFHIPEEPKEDQLYVKELFMGTVKDGGPDPKYQFIQETDGK